MASSFGFLTLSDSPGDVTSPNFSDWLLDHAKSDNLKLMKCLSGYHYWMSWKAGTRMFLLECRMMVSVLISLHLMTFSVFLFECKVSSVKLIQYHVLSVHYMDFLTKPLRMASNYSLCICLGSLHILHPTYCHWWT